jgi:acyl dehydratase
MPERTNGLYYDEMSIGDVYTHPITKTITETDALLFSVLASDAFYSNIPGRYEEGNASSKAIDVEILAIVKMYGIGVERLTLGTTIENIGMSDVRLLRLIDTGDTLRAESEVLDKRESSSCADAGTIEIETRAYNQRNEVVAKFRCLRLIKKK